MDGNIFSAHEQAASFIKSPQEWFTQEEASAVEAITLFHDYNMPHTPSVYELQLFTPGNPELTVGDAVLDTARHFLKEFSREHQEDLS